jgi:hypothetical protein
MLDRGLLQTSCRSVPRQCLAAASAATAADTKTALLPAPFWCTERVDRTHFDWR